MRRRFFTELRRSLRGCRLRPSLGLLLFEEGFTFDLLGFFIPLLFLDRWRYEPHEIMEAWGFSYFDNCVQLKWGRHSKTIWMPWQRERVENDVQRADGSWSQYVGIYERDKEPDGRHLTIYPYRYTLKNGEVQERTATVYVERCRYVWRCLRKLPLFWRMFAWNYYIDVQFSDEVGERTGSWKGGCIGCGYEMKPGETAEQTLRRMERERKF